METLYLLNTNSLLPPPPAPQLGQRAEGQDFSWLGPSSRTPAAGPSKGAGLCSAGQGKDAPRFLRASRPCSRLRVSPKHRLKVGRPGLRQALSDSRPGLGAAERRTLPAGHRMQGPQKPLLDRQASGSDQDNWPARVESGRRISGPLSRHPELRHGSAPLVSVSPPAKRG